MVVIEVGPCGKQSPVDHFQTTSMRSGLKIEYGWVAGWMTIILISPVKVARFLSRGGPPGESQA